LGLGLGLGASESFIADCWYGIRGDQLPVAGYGHTTKNDNEESVRIMQIFCECAIIFSDVPQWYLFICTGSLATG